MLTVKDTRFISLNTQHCIKLELEIHFTNHIFYHKLNLHLKMF